MFSKKDNSYHEICEKSVVQWLDAMSQNEDLEVRGGVRATEGYIEGLKHKIIELERMNDVKDMYLKKMKAVNKKEI